MAKYQKRKKAELIDISDTRNQSDLKSFMITTEKWLDQKNNKCPLWNYLQVEVNKTYTKYSNS